MNWVRCARSVESLKKDFKFGQTFLTQSKSDGAIKSYKRLKNYDMKDMDLRLIKIKFNVLILFCLDFHLTEG